MTPDENFDVFLLLLRRWKRAAFCIVVGAGAAFAYARLAPAWYSSTLSVVPSQHSTNVISALAANLPASLDAGSTDVQRIQAVLTSTSVLDEVIERFDLDKRYGTSYREQTREELRRHCVTDIDRKSGVVSLTCEDTDPLFAKDLASSFGAIGNRVFKRISASSAHEERVFLEKEVEKAKREVDDASVRLRDFSEKHKIIDLPEQSKAVISAMASIKGELLSKQLELSYLSGFSSRGEASVVQLRQQIAILESKLSQLEAAQRVSAPSTNVGSGAGAGSADFFPGALNVPELRFQLEQLLREQKTKETVLALMTERYEMAKADEARDTSTFSILDQPVTATHKSRPRGSKLVPAGAALGAVIAATWILLPIWWRRRTTIATAQAVRE